ncbi:MAG: M23 family metallopeptidase [Bacteroidetes bacterium]|nr:M23 family metallopeptidase [Bacteroidota bacterium]
MLIILLLTGSKTFAADGDFYLNFPLNDWDAYNVPISSAFDHSASSSYSKDNKVVAYSGEIGSTQDYGGTCYCFSNTESQPFSINGNYTGANSCGGAYYLCYDGHPGTDFPIANNTPVYAAADGIVHIPSSFPGVSNAQNYHTLEIDHGNGYKTYYLHLSSFTVSENMPITMGTLIGYSGDYGSSEAYHLHFEVQRNGIPVDPYGWEGINNDPYDRTSNINLWAMPCLEMPQNLSLARIEGQGTTYWIQNGLKYYVTSPTVFSEMSEIPGWGHICDFAAETLNSFPNGPDFIGTNPTSDDLLIKLINDPKVYLIENGQRRWITSEEAFNNLGLDWKDIITVSQNIINLFPEGDTIPTPQNAPYITIAHGIQPGYTNQIDVNNDSEIHFRITISELVGKNCTVA